MGVPGGPGLTPCQGATPGLVVTIRVAAIPPSGFFVTGDSPELLIRFGDRCGNPLKVKQLGTASLYLSGPRLPLLTRTASRLLNCVTDRTAADRQHHYINLLAPKFADPLQKNLTEDPDGTLHYQLAAIQDELPGTYGIGVYAKSQDELDQTFPVHDLQLGTATVETYNAGPSTASSCALCHQGSDSGKLYMHHIIPGSSPVGNYAIDQQPLATCKSCHNQDSYSVQALIRKVHAVHRGAHQLTPGIAHPEYGLATDGSLGAYRNVGFPAMPDQEKDCTKCHVDGRWLTAPSRLGCGTCHENVFFDSGAVTPPRVLGLPAGKACGLDADCGAFGAYGQLAVCNSGTGSCEVRVHPKATDDSQCATCHSADSSGLVPTAAAHEILSRTQVRGLQVQDLTLTGGSGAGGVVLIGDLLTVKFKLTDKAGTLIPDLLTNAGLATTFLLGGPTEDRQRVFGATTIAKAALTFDGTFYTYVLPSGFPATAQTPLNTTGLSPRPNLPGTYSAWLYVAESLTVKGVAVRDAGSALLDFRVGATGPVQPRQVILNAACNSCHVTLQAHGGSRRDAEACSLCHTSGALDRSVGSKGTACTTSSQCGGAAAGWETCQDTNGDGKLDACVMTQDPTPNQSIRLSVMIHAIHYARKREGYSEASNLVAPRNLVIIGFNNSVNDFTQVLFPQDVRNCSKCHADSAASCTTSAPCGIGQQCRAGVCRNSAFTAPSTAVCLSCHDSAAATGHAAIMTWTDKSGNPIETCGVCHDADAEFAVAKVHNISQPYQPPYPRN